jgi:serine/threonine-protein kinase
MHRDLTPTNILLVKKPNGSAQVKVLNFGPAGAGKTGKAEEFGQPANRGWDVAPQLAGMRATSGTVSYMSPEQARGEQLDARSDLFSLGAVMYEMATGKLPFRGNTSALVFVQLLGQMTPDPVRSLNLRIPAPLEQVIMKLLAKNPRARFQSATELIDELQDLAEQRSGWLARVKTRMLAASTANDGSATPGRTSIAGRPRMSFPAAAPYAGRFGLHRAGGAANECAEESARESGEASEEIGTGTKRGFAGLRPVVRGPAVPGAEKTEPSRQEATAAGRTRHAWWWAALVIALALALFILLGGLVA